MKEKLLSILKNRRDDKGFTLIELLVVIAIIAILVVIVVVAINPVQRLNDAADRTAQSNVRSAGTLIGTCITQALTIPGGSVDDCEDRAEVEDIGDGNVPNDTFILPNAPIATVVCSWQEGAAGNFWIYSSNTGEVADAPLDTTPVAADCV